MKINSVHDKAFAPYGKVLTGYNVQPLLDALNNETPLENGVSYVALAPCLQRLAIAQTLSDNAFGGMPIQLGYCNGYNTKLNCLEYHRDSEVNIGTQPFILLIARQDEIIDNMLDTAKVKAFLCPAGTLIEVYATTLHYAPCSSAKAEGFKVLVALAKNTNTDKPNITPLNIEDKMLWARNKWLLAHKDSTEALNGAYVGLIGENIDIENDI